MLYLGVLGSLFVKGKCESSPFCAPLRLGLDLQGGVHLILGFENSEFQNAQNFEKQAQLKEVVEILRKRVDLLGVVEPSLAVSGNDQIVVQLPGVKNFEEAKTTIQRAAHLRLSFVAKAEDQFVDEVRSRETGELYRVERQMQLEGQHIEDAFVSMNEFNQPEVQLQLTVEGQRRFSDLTEPVNRGRLVAIILDGVIESILEIGEPVRTEWVSIEFRGSQSIEDLMKEANSMVTVLKSGALPFQLFIKEERTVGPTLGEDFIQKGSRAVLLSLFLMIGFLLIYYKVEGVIGVIAILVNLGLVIVGLTHLQASLTLPGIAALVLTAGMSVDATILIYERMKELRRLGERGDSLIGKSFQRVSSSLIDSYITTALTALILVYFGTGPIRGFGVVLLLGIFNTLLTVVFILYPFNRLLAQIKIGLSRS